MSLTKKHPTTLPALNVQRPWAMHIVSGKKSIETRTYPLPRSYIHRPILLIETPGSVKRAPSRIIGVVIFGEPFQYRDKESFDNDQLKHLVKPGDDFYWTSKSKKWGWPVVKRLTYSYAVPTAARRGIVYTREVPVPMPLRNLLKTFCTSDQK